LLHVLVDFVQESLEADTYEAAMYVLLELWSLLWKCLQRLWAEVEDKNKKLAQLTKERDNLSIEMEKQVEVSSILLSG
jgi:uncharacterized protein YlxW (UPF0749 family)